MSERVMGFEVEIESVTEPIEVEIMSGTQGATTLAGLNDTLISSPQDGEALIFDETDNKWENKEIAPTFTEAEARANIVSGETLSVLFGKIKKFFSDLKTVAFTNDYNDLDNKPSIPSAQIQSDWTQTDDSEVDYIKHKPTLGTASEKDVPVSGNASTTEVVLGSDTRLSDSRPASDVYSWAKAETKPTYTASEVGAIPTTDKGSVNGVAELDSTGRVPSSQLPSYVDDVRTYDSINDFPLTGEDGIIYIAKDTNKTYRWSGTAYVEISESLALGETSSTAYRGDRGKTAYDHATDSSRLTTATANGLYKVGSTAEGHIASLTAVQKTDITRLGIPAQDTITEKYFFGGEVTIPSNDYIFSGQSDFQPYTIPNDATFVIVTDSDYDLVSSVNWSNHFLTVVFYNPFDTALTINFKVYYKTI